MEPAQRYDIAENAGLLHAHQIYYAHLFTCLALPRCATEMAVRPVAGPLWIDGAPRTDTF